MVSVGDGKRLSPVPSVNKNQSYEVRRLDDTHPSPNEARTPLTHTKRGGICCVKH